MNQLIAILIANLSLVGAIALFFYSTWLDFIRPDWFYIFRIYENGMLNYREHKLFLPLKKKKDSYEINGNLYDKTGVGPYIDPKGVYTWNFIQGQSKPIKFPTDKENIDAKLVNEARKQTVDNWWVTGNGIEDFLKTYGVFIVGFILLILIGYMITKNQQQNNLTTQLLINLTRRG